MIVLYFDPIQFILLDMILEKCHVVIKTILLFLSDFSICTTSPSMLIIIASMDNFHF